MVNGISILGALLMGFTTNSQSLFTVWSICARLGVFAASAGTWVHTPELFRTEMRATGHAVSNASAQIGSAVVPFMVYRLRARGTVSALLVMVIQSFNLLT